MITRMLMLLLMVGMAYICAASRQSCDMCSCQVLSNPTEQVLYLNCSHTQKSGKPAGSMFAPRYETYSKFNASRIWATFESNAIEKLQEFPVDKVEKLSLANNKLKFIHMRAFLYTRNLKELSLASNSLTEFTPKMFQYLTTLEKLDVSKNELETFPSVSMPSLIELDLSGNSIGYVKADMFKGLPLLTTLDLSANKITRIQVDAFSGIKRLRHLSLADNLLDNLNNVNLDRVTMLLTLDLSSNGLANLNAVNLAHLKSLSHLDVSNNTLTSLPGLPTSVNQLNMGYNRFHNLGLILAGLVNLEALRLEGNRLSNLQGCNLTNLQVLNVSRNELEAMYIESVSKLRILDISHNKLNAIPPGVSPTLLPSLEELVLDGNSMEELGITYNSAERGFENLTSVSACNMSKLQTLGAGFFKAMTSCAKCTLRPQQVSQRLGELEELKCDRQISIKVAHNPALSKIHPDTFRGINVCQLDLSYNSLRSIDSALVDWNQTNEVNLQGNPWDCQCGLQWMVDRVVPHILRHNPQLLYELRCETPVQVRSRRMVHFFNWTMAFCNKFERMREAVNLTDTNTSNEPVLTSSSNLALIIVLSLMAVLVVLVTVGLVLQRKLAARRRLRNRKL